ncbi:MAG: hypothetical protein SGCHY_001003 [Lobulomycetales sp.]
MKLSLYSHLLFLLCLLCLSTSFTAAQSTEVSASEVGDQTSTTLAAQSDTVRKLTAPAGVVGGLLIAAGLLFIFLGYRMFKVVCFLAGFYFGASLAYIILSAAEPSDLYANRDLVYLLVSLAAGIVTAFLFLCVWRLGLAAIGALAGFALALFILSWASGGAISSGTGRSIFIGVLALLGSILIHFIEKPFLIVSTSLAGSFSFVYGVDVFARKGFVEAVQFFLGNSDSGSRYVITGSVYGMLASIIVITVIGIVVQWRLWRGHTHRERK